MTGGQLAPTTLLGQTTATTPFGRLQDREGGPIHMAEVIEALDRPGLCRADNAKHSCRGYENPQGCAEGSFQPG